MIRMKWLSAAFGFCVSFGAWDVCASEGVYEPDNLTRMFSWLPRDVQKIVVEKLSDDDLRSCAIACRGMRAITSQDIFWVDRYQKYYIFPMNFYTEVSLVAKEIWGGTYMPTYDDESVCEQSDDWTLNDFQNFNNDVPSNLTKLVLPQYPRYKTLIQCRDLVANQIYKLVKSQKVDQRKSDQLMVAEEFLVYTSSTANIENTLMLLKGYLVKHVCEIYCMLDISSEEKSDRLLILLNRFIVHGSKFALREKEDNERQGFIIKE